MHEKVTLKKAIAVVKLSLFVIWFWPLPLNTSKRKLLCMKLYQYVCILLTIVVLASMMYALVKNVDDLDLAVKSSLGLFPCSHVIGNILCHLAIYQRLQVINTNAVTENNKKLIKRIFFSRVVSRNDTMFH